jgi:hypothetical protein
MIYILFLNKKCSCHQQNRDEQEVNTEDDISEDEYVPVSCQSYACYDMSVKNLKNTMKISTF